MAIKYLRILLLCGMLCSTIALRAQSKNYLHSTYKTNGGSALLANIPGWRSIERQNILSSIAKLPDSIRQSLIITANDALRHSWPVLSWTDYREFKENGNRINFEKIYFERRTKLSALCAGELVTHSGKYLPEIANGIWLIMEESTWVLPAHLSGQQAIDGPDPDNPIIDLFAAETAAHLAWVKLLLGNELNQYSPRLQQRMDSELNKRIVTPYLANNDYWWMGLNTNRKQNNWNIWINTNILKTAALAIDDATKREAIIDKTLKCADAFLNTYPADGGCDEGPAYWTAAGGCLGDYLSMLNRLSAGKLNWSNSKLIHNIGSYIYKVHIDSTRFVNFADAPGSTIPDAGRVYNFGELFNDGSLKSFAAYLARLHKTADGWLAPSSIIMFANNVRVSNELLHTLPVAPMPKQNWLPDLEVINLRATAGTAKGLSFMAKAGNNGESHNHNDVGNFMLYLNGAPVLIDLGKGTYTKQTFSADRYKLWYIQSQWHNCPTVNGQDQQAGSDFIAQNVVYKPGTSTETFSMDLSKTFPPQAAVTKWQREFTYKRRTGEVTLNERYALSAYVAPSVARFVCCKKPVLTKDGLIRIPAFAGQAWVSMKYDPAILEAHIQEQPNDDASLRSVWGKNVYRISLQLKSHDLSGSYQVTFHEEKP